MRSRPFRFAGQNGFTGFPQRDFSSVGMKHWRSFYADTECPKTWGNTINFRGN